jgi:hypothetical protein
MSLANFQRRSKAKPPLYFQLWRRDLCSGSYRDQAWPTTKRRQRSSYPSRIEDVKALTEDSQNSELSFNPFMPEDTQTHAPKPNAPSRHKKAKRDQDMAAENRDRIGSSVSGQPWTGGGTGPWPRFTKKDPEGISWVLFNCIASTKMAAGGPRSTSQYLVEGLAWTHCFLSQFRIGLIVPADLHRRSLSRE